MPTYQYACTACDHRFEEVQAFSDASLTDCPTCTGSLRKVFSSVGIVFKGSGFYRTDSRAGPVAKGESKSEPSGSTGSSGDKDTVSTSSSSSGSDSSGSGSAGSGKGSAGKGSAGKGSARSGSSSARSGSGSSGSSTPAAAAS